MGVHQAKTNLSQLLRRVQAGEEIVITRGGEPAARLAPCGRPRLRLGLLRGVLVVPEDFDRPLAEAEILDFER